MLMFFRALSISPLAKVTALSFTTSIFTAILAVLVLGERFRIYWSLAILLGFIGMLILPALWVWQPFGLHTFGWMILIGLFGTIAQLSLRQALKETDPTALMLFDFLKLIWRALIGAWFFAEIPDIYTWIGAAVSFSSGLFIAFRERQTKSTA